MSNYGWKNNGISLKSLKGSTQSVTAAGNVNVTDLITEITSSGAIALVLENGTKGQIKIIKMISDGGDATLTPTSFLDNTTITFDNTDYAVLYYNGSAWCLISGNAAIA